MPNVIFITIQVEYLDDNFFNDDDDNDKDDDYVPPKLVKNKVKFRKPKLNDIKVYNKEKKTTKAFKSIKSTLTQDKSGKSKTSLITCCKFSSS